VVPRWLVDFDVAFDFDVDFDFDFDFDFDVDVEVGLRLAHDRFRVPQGGRSTFDFGWMES
jgi:hypothetical protein